MEEKNHDLLMFIRLKIMLFLFFAAALALFSCHPKKNHIVRGFYYWKTNLSLSIEEKHRMDSLGIKKLYLRFFDVSINSSGAAMPVARVNIGRNSLPGSVKIIPVVFITNKTLASSNDSLAENIYSLIGKTAAAAGLSFDEIQIDCDWSLQTKERFFSLLRSIRSLAPGKTLSCTIRLHQVKYFRRTGVPPVDRGMLMFYNMGKIEDDTRNSIFNKDDAAKYVSFVRDYPLPLDVALPVFGWAKHYHGSKIIGLINDVQGYDLASDSSFENNRGLVYHSKKDMFFRGEYIQQGDNLVLEEVRPELTSDAAKMLQKNIKADSFTVVLYHWDNHLLKYEQKNIEDIYRRFQ